MFTIADVIRLLTRIFVKKNKRFPKGLEGVDIRIKAKEIFDVEFEFKFTDKQNKQKKFLLNTPEQFNLGKFLTWAFTKRLHYKRQNNG